jgi:aldose 1-epimerase
MTQLKTKQSRLYFDLETTGRLSSLEFLHNSRFLPVLQFDSQLDFYLSGNFLMFPWVNRLSQSNILIGGKLHRLKGFESDGNGFPIHGLYQKAPRRLLSQTENSLSFEPLTVVPEFPHFRETYTLLEQALVVRTEFWNESTEIQSFAYGYHPYLELGKPLDKLELKLDLEHWIPLDDRSLPTSELSPKETILSGTSLSGVKLDHLFFTKKTGIIRVQLWDPQEGVFVQISTNIEENHEKIALPYFQIYTPEKRNRLAIEPMCAAGDVFTNPISSPITLAPGEKRFGEWAIEWNPS